jgi:SpoVK/Ycf46/Vps4 family AAA+-type ATPase
MMEYFLLSRLSTSNFFIDALILFLLIPFIQLLSNHVKTDLPLIIHKIKRSKWNVITFSGWDNLHNGVFYFDYPYPMTAICYLINKKNLSTNLKYVNLSRNALFFTDQVTNKINKEVNINYILDDKENIKVSDDIYIDVVTYKMSSNNGDNKTSSADINWRVDLSIKSKVLSIEKIKEFISDSVREFKEFEEKKNANKIYHFIYQGWDDNKDIPKFSTSILSNLEIESQKNFEKFESLFSEHKESLMKSINRLKDIEYYKRTGMKRKIGYLFYGPPGCGKTSHVVAMANYDNSHIIEIPMSRVKKNKEIESILNISSINGITIEKEKLIIFFDEIDQAGKALAKREGEKTEEEKENKEESNTKDLMLMSLLSSKSDNANIFDKKDDQLNLGCVLSRLDGIGNYNGLKIIAATNCKDKLSPALYRHGRLTPMFFDYCRKEDIINMIEHYYQIKLSEEQKTKIPDKSHQISPATIRKYLEDYEEDSKGLINYLHNKVK